MVEGQYWSGNAVNRAFPGRRAELCQLLGPFKFTWQRWGTHQRRPSGRLGVKPLNRYAAMSTCARAGTGLLFLTRIRQLTPQAPAKGHFVNIHTLAGHSPVPGTHPPATVKPASGRRRATPLVQGRRRTDPTADGPSRHRGRKAALAVIASGLALTASLASAHAATPQNPAGPAVQAAGTSAPAASAPVTAAAGAQLDFARTEVTTSPAPPVPANPKPAPAQKETSAAETPSPQTVEASKAQASGERVPPAKARLSSPVLDPVLNSPFGYRANPLTGAAGEMHTGQDFAAGCGTEVFSAGKGTVIEAGFSPYGGGNRIVIDHGNGLQTTYNHLETIGVRINQAVETGVRIGIVGTTGNSTGCHLHFEVVVNGQTVDPSAWL